MVSGRDREVSTHGLDERVRLAPYILIIFYRYSYLVQL